MNLGISNTQFGTWKRIKAQHIAAAAGVALAVSAVIGRPCVTPSRNDSSKPPAPARSGRRRHFRLSQPAPQPEKPCV